MHSLCKKYSSKKRQRVLLIQGRERCCGRTGERTPLVPLQACAGWAKTVNCHAHPRILLPQNRCLPEPLAAPFPHQPEPRCNTLDFASKVVCQRAFRRSLDSSRQGTGKWGALCSTGRIRHLAQKIDCKFYLTIRGICTIIAMR